MRAEPDIVIAFARGALVARGSLAEVARAAVQRVGEQQILIFDAVTSRPVEVDLRGSVEEVLARLPAAPPAQVTPSAPRSPGRPRLGVVSREVTLLPRHWEWLAGQRGGASAALRRLVEGALRTSGPVGRRRAAQESTYRFAAAMAGDEAGFEEAIRALYAGGAERFDEMTATWASDVRDHARALAAAAFAEGDA